LWAVLQQQRQTPRGLPRPPPSSLTSIPSTAPTAQPDVTTHSPDPHKSASGEDSHVFLTTPARPVIEGGDDAASGSVSAEIEPRDSIVRSGDADSPPHDVDDGGSECGSTGGVFLDEGGAQITTPSRDDARCDAAGSGEAENYSSASWLAEVFDTLRVSSAAIPPSSGASKSFSAGPSIDTGVTSAAAGAERLGDVPTSKPSTSTGGVLIMERGGGRVGLSADSDDSDEVTSPIRLPSGTHDCICFHFRYHPTAIDTSILQLTVSNSNASLGILQQVCRGIH